MKILFRAFLALTSVFLGLHGEEITDQSTKISFPKEVSFEANGKNYELEATGVTTRKKLIIKVYSIAHYLQKGIQNPSLNAIMSDENAKQFTIKWIRDVSQDKVQEAFQDSFKRVFPGNTSNVQASNIETFKSYFQGGAKEGDEYILRWIPGGLVEVILNGQKKGTVKNKAFAEGLWAVWLGDNSIVNRNALLTYLH